MSLDSEDNKQADSSSGQAKLLGLLARIAEKIPEPVRTKFAELKARYLAASRRTQYAIAGGAGVLVLALLFVRTKGNMIIKHYLLVIDRLYR